MIDPLVRPPVAPQALQSLQASRDDDEAPPSRPLTARLAGARDELSEFVTGIELRRLAWSTTRWIRGFTLSRTRARLLSAVGCEIGPGTAVAGYVHLVGPRDCARRLRVGPGCLIGPEVTLCLDAPIVLGRNVSIGPHAMLYTATHSLGVASRRMELEVLARPISVGDGAWIGLGAIILPGVRVGRGAVVAAGSVVNDDVPDNALFAGNPARLVQDLPIR